MINKQVRNPEKFDVFDLYAEFCRSNAIPLNGIDSVEKVRDLFGLALEKHVNNPSLVFGKRVETMFAFVAAGLGKCSLIKQEDGGEVYCNYKISVPDYRLVLGDNTTILVEVKNYHPNPFKSPFTMKADYVDSLTRYGELVNCEVKVAVFFSFLKQWVLLSMSDFALYENVWSISAENAVKRNEMLMLGDMSIGTKPPLEVYIEADNKNPATFNKETGEAKFTAKGVTFGCDGVKLERAEEKELCYSFMLFGNWEETSVVPVIKGDRLLGLNMKYEPVEAHPEQGFDIVGSISSMLIQMYKHITEKDGEVIATKVDVAPQNFHALIPEDYDGENLPLWRFSNKPNKD